MGVFELLDEHYKMQQGGTWEKQKAKVQKEKFQGNNLLEMLQEDKDLIERLSKKDRIKKETNTKTSDNTKVNTKNKPELTSKSARNKTDKEIAEERKAKIEESVKYQDVPFTQDNWREVLAKETQSTGDKFRVSLEPNFFDDYLNPAVMIGDMASNLGQAPLQAQQSDSVLPYVTSIGTPLVVGATAGIGTQNTGQFVNNVANPLAGTGALIGDFKGVVKEVIDTFNPKLMNAKSGEKWINEWYNHPETKIKASAYDNIDESGNFKELDGATKIEIAKQDLKQYKDKNYLDLLEDKGMKTYLNKILNTQGLSYGTPENIYVKSQPLYGFNKVGRESTKVHELTHLAENNGRILNTKENDALLEPFGYSEQLIFGTDKTPLQVLGNRDKAYYIDPTEIHARMNEARYQLGLNPDDIFTPEQFDKIQKEKDWFGMGKYIKDKDKFVKLMNNFYTTVPIAGATYLATQDNKQQGGKINYSENEKKFLEEVSRLKLI